LYHGKKRVIIVSCGGTGGHLVPGLSLGAYLSNTYNIEVVYLVNMKKITSSFLNNMNLEVIVFPEIQYTNLVSLKLFSIIFKIIKTLFSLIKLFFKYKILFIVSAGSGAGFLPVVLYRLLGIKSALLEQNAIMGKANKILSYVASYVFLSFPCINVKENDKLLVTGNPVKQDFLNNILKKDDAAKVLGLHLNVFTILFMGGSQGASSLNEIAIKIISQFLNKRKDFQVIHLTGESNFESCKDFYLKKNVSVYCEKFSNQMQEVYILADIAVSRAGGGSLSELIHFNIPVISIPFPYASEKHQHANAQILVDKDCGWLFDENDFKDENTVCSVVDILLDNDKQRLKKDNLDKFFKINTYKKITDKLDDILKY